MDIEYRKLKPSDTKRYRDLRLESLKNYPDSFCSTYDDQILKPKLAFETYIGQDQPDKFIIGAFHKDQLIGICGFFRQSDKRSNHRGEVVQMYVQPTYQGEKIGQTLLEVTLKEAFKIQEIEQIELGVLTNSKAASRIYDRVGFQEYGLQKNFIKANNNYSDQRLMVLYRNRKVRRQ